jgi:hypothetical protein
MQPFPSGGDVRRSVATVQSLLLDGRAAVNFPSRVVLALAVLGGITAIGVWGIVLVLRVRNMTQPQRMMAIAGIVILMTVLAAWVILWPAYWD